MKRTGKLLVSTMIAAAGAVSTALALSTTAAAEPAPPTNPGVPGMEILSQLSNVQAAAPQVIQSIASALAGTPATPVTPAAPRPGATASVTLPQPPALPAAATPAARLRPRPLRQPLPATCFSSLSSALPAPTCQHGQSGPVASERASVAQSGRCPRPLHPRRHPSHGTHRHGTHRHVPPRQHPSRRPATLPGAAGLLPMSVLSALP